MPWAGVSPRLRELLKEFPQIKLHNSHHNAVTTGEMAIALLMAAARQISTVDQKMHQLDWSPRQNSDQINYVLWGQTALILGFGAIGQHVAKVCQALGMDVIGIRRDPNKPIAPGLNAEVYTPADLSLVLPRTNVLIITMPHTDETMGMIGKAEFDLMPDDSLLVNVGRGAVVDQFALYEALTNGKLRAAGIDVWYNYPRHGENTCQPADAPLHQLDNLIMSPHRGGAGGTGQAEQLRAREMAKLLNAAARGEVMPNQVDLELGY
jgi:phosphoglycerate dehydrogenase-like enzyme